MQTVKMYSTGTCPYCLRAKQILKAKGVAQIEEIGSISILRSAP